DDNTRSSGQRPCGDGVYCGWQPGEAMATFGPHDQVKGQNRGPGGVRWNLESSNVKADFEKLRRAAATVVREPYRPGDDDDGDFWIATFSDPDNNYFQLMSPMPEASGSSSTTSAGSTSGRGG